MNLLRDLFSCFLVGLAASASVWLDPRNYTAHVSGTGGATGVPLTEVYEVR